MPAPDAETLAPFIEYLGVADPTQDDMIALARHVFARCGSTDVFRLFDAAREQRGGDVDDAFTKASIFEEVCKNGLWSGALAFIGERVHADPGLAFDPAVLTELAVLKRDNKPRFERARKAMREAGVRVSELDREIAALMARENDGPAHRVQRARNQDDDDRQNGTANWPGMCHTNRFGELLGNLHNALIVLRNAPEFVNRLGYDEMTHTVVVQYANGRVVWKPLTDVLTSSLQERMQTLGLKTVGRDVVHQAIQQRAAERSFHPVRDYLRRLQWDGTPRLDSWLVTYCRAAPTEKNADYVRLVGRSFFLSLVARVMRPGCKVDSVLILEGPQGRLKSTAAKIIGGEWFSDSMPPITSGKDAMQHLRGKWLIELGELAAMSKAEAGHLKQFLTVTTDKYRPSYGREEVEYARQCVFIGTTNENRYLIDATGGRRFWPISVTAECDAAGLTRDRDQLFAEALVAFNAGEKWWLPGRVEREQAAAEQEERHDADAWEQTIAQYLINMQGATVTDILTKGLDVLLGHVDDRASKRVQKCLRRLGWVPKRDASRRWWEPGPDWTPPIHDDAFAAARRDQPGTDDEIPF